MISRAFFSAFSRKVEPSSTVSWTMPASFMDRISSNSLPRMARISTSLCALLDARISFMLLPHFFFFLPFLGLLPAAAFFAASCWGWGLGRTFTGTAVSAFCSFSGAAAFTLWTLPAAFFAFCRASSAFSFRLFTVE